MEPRSGHIFRMDTLPQPCDHKDFLLAMLRDNSGGEWTVSIYKTCTPNLFVSNGKEYLKLNTDQQTVSFQKADGAQDGCERIRVTSGNIKKLQGRLQYLNLQSLDPKDIDWKEMQKKIKYRIPPPEEKEKNPRDPFQIFPPSAPSNDYIIERLQKLEMGSKSKDYEINQLKYQIKGLTEELNILKDLHYISSMPHPIPSNTNSPNLYHPPGSVPRYPNAPQIQPPPPRSTMGGKRKI